MATPLGLSGLLSEFEPWRARLAQHPMYSRLRTVDDVRSFMEHHVFAVWDFMSLLKALQRHLTCMDKAWRPVGAADTRRLVNELILEEETDVIDGEAISHFEYYCRAMHDAGADTGRIEALLDLLRNDVALDDALLRCNAPEASRQFVLATFATIGTGKPHVIASAFTFGREESIPAMFGGLIRSIRHSGRALDTFGRYLDRHIELDGDSHAPKALRMLADLCGDDQTKWDEATQAAVSAIVARLALWDAIADAVETAPAPMLVAA